ncbi:pectin lyase fold/virulence factor [Geopyxis carbonaria]|nr:pectin lyase fold/virulence factor [Geopyxis carbonaria]
MTYDPLPPALTVTPLLPSFPSFTSNTPPSPFILTVNNVLVPTHSNHEYTFSTFSLTSPGAARLGITLTSHAPLTSIRISPLKLGIQGKINASGHTAWCTLPGAGYYIIKLSEAHELLVLIESPQIDVPVLSDPGVLNVLSYGALSNGTDLPTTTAAFCAALAHVRGPTTIFVPAGRYLVGNLVLPSYTTLYLSAGAELIFSGERKDYTRHWWKTSQSRPVTWWISTAFHSTHISITGRGTLDGTLGGQAIAANLVVPIATRHFRCEGITLLNSPSWALTTILSLHVDLRNLKLLNRFRDAGENDGIDIMHSSHVRISRCVGVGLDDPFSTKTWSRSQGDIAHSWPAEVPDPLPPCRDVLFSDLLSWTICFGVKIGAGVLTPHEDVRFEDVVVYDASIAIGIHHAHGTAMAKRVTFRNIDVEQVRQTNMNKSTWLALMCESRDFERAGPDMGSVVVEIDEDRNTQLVRNRPCIQDILVENITVRDAGHTGAFIFGWSEHCPISDVVLRNVVMPNGECAQCLDDLGVGAEKPAPWGGDPCRERVRIE